MLDPTYTPSGDQTLLGRTELVDFFVRGCKPASAYRIGTEHEQFVYYQDSGAPVEYDGERPGLRRLLEGLTRFGWELIAERGNPTSAVRDGAKVSLEPGGQLEFSSAPYQTLHELYASIVAFHSELTQLGQELGLCFVGIGFQPQPGRDRLPWMPRPRYEIMRGLMASTGSMGHDMMQGTASVQVNLDYCNEEDMVRKLRVAQALQPVMTALFVNSPYVDGQVTGRLSHRMHVWDNIDESRCGLLPFVAGAEMGFGRYVDFLVDRPMFFVRRNGALLPAGGQTFREFMTRQLHVLPGERPVISDWELHATTVFPEVRLKRHLELRGADGNGNPSIVAALAALWTGILYDERSLEQMCEQTSGWKFSELCSFRAEVSRHGLKARLRGETAGDIFLRVIELARNGLQRRHRMNDADQDESVFLEVAQTMAHRGRTFAEYLMERHGTCLSQDAHLAMGYPELEPA